MTSKDKLIGVALILLGVGFIVLGLGFGMRTNNNQIYTEQNPQDQNTENTNLPQGQVNVYSEQVNVYSEEQNNVIETGDPQQGGTTYIY